MSSAPVLLIADPRERILWEDALRSRNLEVIGANRRTARREAGRRAPAAIIVSEKLPFMGSFRVIRDLRRDPATREAPVVLVGSRPISTAMRVRLGTSAPDATVEPGASAEAVADAVVEAMRRGKLPPPELTRAQQAGLRYNRLGTLLMVFGVVFSFPIQGPADPEKSWFILLIPLGGLVSDIATGRVDGRKKLLSWQGWAAIGIAIAIALGIVYFPRFFRLS
jgi:CheY-like chemotaxis protein